MEMFGHTVKSPLADIAAGNAFLYLAESLYIFISGILMTTSCRRSCSEIF